ncbi:MAG: rod shape-determining protein MreC [Candidatus Korobacteraceae bacterium]
MESFFARHKNATILAVVLMAQILGLATQIRRPTESGPVRLIRQWAVALVTPFGRGFVYSEQLARHAWHDYFYLRGVRHENVELREQIEHMRLDQIRIEQDAAQARRIQALLQFKEQYISKTVAAQVVGSSGSETSHIVYIDRGSNVGIESNMAVITPEGIVGKVLRVYPSTAQVLEITDQTSGVGATLVKSRLQGILKGQSTGNPNLAYIMADEKVESGEDVITSGGDRIFPKGLPIGKVASVSPGKDLFLNVRVTPSANLSRLEEVLVITQIVEKQVDTTGLGPIRAADILAQRLPSVPDKPAETTPKPAASSAAQAASPNSGAPTASTPGAAGTKPAASANPSVPVPGSTGGKPVTPGANAAPKPGNAKPSVPVPDSTGGKPVAAGAAASKPVASPANGAPAKPKATQTPPAKSTVAKPATDGEDTP